MKAKAFKTDGTENGTVDLPVEVFGVEINEALLHQVITSLLTNRRQGTSKTKTRAEVSGGGRKPFKQKGTGRARAGSNTSPVWVRGGKAFGAKPRVWGGTIPKKMRRIALCSAYTSRARDGHVMVVESIDSTVVKTKIVADLFKKINVSDKKNLLVINRDSRNIYLSGRNIKNVLIKCVSDVNAYDVLSCENIVFGGEGLIEQVKEVVLSE